MSKGKKTGGKNFEKGNKANPNGRPKLTDEERAVKTLSREQFNEIANLLLSKSFNELRELRDDSKTSSFQSWLIKVILKSSDRGDYYSLDKLLDRLIGKVPDKLDVEQLHVIQMLKQVEGLSDDQLMALGDQAREFLKGDRE